MERPAQTLSHLTVRKVYWLLLLFVFVVFLILLLLLFLLLYFFLFSMYCFPFTAFYPLQFHIFMSFFIFGVNPFIVVSSSVVSSVRLTLLRNFFAVRVL